MPELMNTPGVVVALGRNGWMNEELTMDRVWGSLNFGRRLLVWDAYKCHIMDSVRSCVDKHTNTDVSIIPGGLTSQLQPADVSWNKPFKAAYKTKYNDWMATGSKSYMPAGNVCTPSKALCLQWVVLGGLSVQSRFGCVASLSAWTVQLMGRPLPQARWSSC